MTKPTINIYGANFLGYAKSATYRGQNADKSPLFFDWRASHLHEAKFVCDGGLKDCASPNNQIAWLLEPRCLRPENYEYVEKHQHDFERIFTHDKELHVACDNAHYYLLGGSSIPYKKWKIYRKSKGVCIFYSGKDTTEGHKLRKEIVKKFGDKIDVYGAGVGRTVKTKFEILKEYRYCVVVESCRRDFYFTEKLIDPISVGCVPIYWGSPSIKNVFEKHALEKIRFPKFSNLDELNDCISLSGFPNFTYWLSYKTPPEYVEQYRCAENWLYINRLIKEEYLNER